MLSILITNWLL